MCFFKAAREGKFSAPWRHQTGGELQMTISELALLLEGSELISKVAISLPPLVLGEQPIHFR
jgi:transposase